MKEKEQYFAAHWTQMVAKEEDDSADIISSIYHRNIQDIEYIELKPLSAISDEDAVEVAKIISGKQDEAISKLADGVVFVSCGTGEIGIWEDGEILFSNFDEQCPLSLLSCYDYLRSKGYALLWRNYSVNKLIEMGWLKLKND